MAEVPDPDALNVGILSDELSTVSDWYQLGIKLGVPDYKLAEIQRSYPTEGCSRWKVEALSLWLRCTPNSSWRSVVRALQQMGENALAERMQQKYIRRRSFHPVEEDCGAVAIARENRQKINWKFGVLLKNSCKKLREKHINVQDFRLFLKGLFPRGDCIPESSNVDEIFEAITHNKLWDHWNCSPLQQAVQEFVGDDQEMKSWIETYKKDLTSYKATTKLVDYIAVVDSDPSGEDSSSEEQVEEQEPAKYDRRYYRKLSIKLETKFTSHTLEYLDDLWKEFADLYNLPPLVTLLDCVRKSSILIVWLIPAHLAPQILRAAPQSVDFFQKHQITRMEFDGVCIYPEAKHHSGVTPGLVERTVDQLEVCRICFRSTSHKLKPTFTPESKATFDVSMKKKKCSICHQEWAPVTVAKEIGGQEVGVNKWVTIRPKPNIRANIDFQMCRHVQSRIECPKGQNCSYAHSKVELLSWNKERQDKLRPVPHKPRPVPHNGPYQLCKHMQNTGTCQYGQRCKFAHSEEELRSWLSVQAGTSKGPSTNAVMGGTQVGLEFRCDECNLLCTSTKQLDDHVSESKHKQQVEAHTLQPYDPTPAQSMWRIASVRGPPSLPFHSSGYKLCFHIQMGRQCVYGDDCRFAHSQHELDEWNSQLQNMRRIASVRRRPLFSFPSSGYKLCPHIQVGRQCIYGDYCTFAHSQGELDEWNSQLQIVNTPPIGTDTVMFHGGGLPPYSPPVALTTTMPGAGPVGVGMGGAPTPLVPGEVLKPYVSGLDDLEDKMVQESQDFAFLLRTRIVSQHKQNQGFEKMNDCVTISEISGQELSLTLSQTDKISWNFEVSITAPRILCSIVLFDPLTTDFNIDGVWLVMHGGQQRTLNGTRAVQGVGIQINQKISPLDRVHVKLSATPQSGILGQLVLFDFGTFHKVQGLTVYVLNDQKARLLQISQSTRAKKPQKYDLYWEQHYSLIRMTTSYQEETDHLLPEYPLPQQIGKLIEAGKYSNVEDRVTKDNYKRRMHNLLCLEEYQQRLDMSRYDMYDVEITPSKEYHTGDMGTQYAPAGYYYIKVTLDELLFEGGRSVRTTDRAFLLLVYQHKVHECDVEHVGRESIILKITEEAQQASASGLNRCGIRFLPSRVQMQSMHYAVDCVDLNTIFPSSQMTATNSLTSPSILRCLQEVKNSKLNNSQQNAIVSMLDPACSQIPSLVLGPFGCGKTRTLSECVKLLGLFAPEKHILVCTHTNSAADFYVEELHAEWKRRGYEKAPLFRLYFTGRKLDVVSHTVKEYCKIENGQLAIPTLKELQLYQIIVTTLSTSRALALMGMPKGHFSHIFIDEAAQALEPETLIPLTIANEQTKIVLAGDHMQMDPPVYSDLARQHGLHVSLLVRLYDHEAYDSGVGQYCKILLTENRRTHQQILELPSKLFYNNKLTCRAVFPITGPKDIPAIKFIGVNGHEAQDEDSPSYYNYHEGIRIVVQVQMLVSRGLQPEDICVLAYYSRQVKLIRNLLHEKGLFPVNVYRVDNVPGKEFRALLISTIRTCSTELPNSKEEVGFLTSPKLFNTAITRAREWLIVVGEPITLCTVGSNRLCWLEFIRNCHKLGTFEYPNANNFEKFLETKLITRQILEKIHESFFRKMESALEHNIHQQHIFKSKISEAIQSGDAAAISKITADSHQEEMSKAISFKCESRQAINETFAILLKNVCIKMLKNGVDVDTLRLFIVALFRPGDCIPPVSTNLMKIFEAITHHGLWDSLHYSPLVQIVRKFGADDPEMEAWIQDYKKNLKAYTIVASIEDYIQSDLDTDRSPVNRAKYDPRYSCPVEWKTDFLDHSLQHLTNVWELFSDQYLGPDSPPTALLDRVWKDCVSVTWLVPSYLIPQLVKTAKVNIAFFQKHRILKVTAGNEVVYEGEVAEEINEAPLAHQKEKLKIPAPEESFGGYECEFVEPPASAFQTKCPVCRLILREPYQITCCGTSFCRTCIQRLQADNSACPICREDNFQLYPNKGLKRSLKQLQVYCTHRKDGCQWTAELGELDQHLNECKGCPLTMENKEEDGEDAKPEKSSRASSVHSKGKPTLQELSSHVIMEVVTTWHSLGIQLGLSSQLLDAIEQAHSKNSQRCCEEIFKQWLVHPELEPSWSSLIKALESDAVSQRELARELKQYFIL